MLNTFITSLNCEHVDVGELFGRDSSDKESNDVFGVHLEKNSLLIISNLWRL
jgi:hypothetical protein